MKEDRATECGDPGHDNRGVAEHNENYSGPQPEDSDSRPHSTMERSTVVIPDIFIECQLHMAIADFLINVNKGPSSYYLVW